ncbi:syndecan-2-A-like [Aplochiton taeniatus]
MGTFWMLFFLGLATTFNENIFVEGKSPSSSPADDLYLEETQSGDFPVDDEDDFSSGSGSGLSGIDDVTMTREVEMSKTFIDKVEAMPPLFILPNRPATTVETPSRTTTPGESQDPPTPTEDSFMFTEQDTELFETETTKSTFYPGPCHVGFFSCVFSVRPSQEPVDVTSAPSDARENRRLYLEEKEDVEQPKDVTSENLFQRTEVLAAVIAGGVIGFLFALFLILLLVYRMKKKDEGSYALGERKPPPTAYQKAPTKEFYA